MSFEKYPMLRDYTNPVKKAEREIVGREKEIRSMLAAFMRPELCNVILLGEAGSGKTALVQGAMLRDSNRMYIEVDLARMIANLNDPNEMAAKLKSLFDEATRYGKEEGRELVLFIDEFHQIVQLSEAAVEALKPLLADSGTRGIRVVAATTYEEFRKFISPNQPLVERLQRINLKQADKDLTVSILRGMAERYGVGSQFYNDSLFELIYEYTNRYIPANAQPRKSILILDAMVGWARSEGLKLDRHLLADVIRDTEGVTVDFNVDAQSIKARLDSKVLAQQYATSTIESRLQICVADLNDKSKPMSTFLFTGSTGVGKLVGNEVPVPVMPSDKNGVFWKNHGDLQVGDVVFARDGSPTMITGVFPHKDVQMYRVVLTDGRTLDVGDAHLWAVYTSKQRSRMYQGANVSPMVLSTQELVDKGVVRTYAGDSRRHLKWFIPANGAVQWPEAKHEVDPYVVGAFIGNGCLREDILSFSSDDMETVEEVARLIGASSWKKDLSSYSWQFGLSERVPVIVNGKETAKWRAWFHTRDLFADMPEIYGVYSKERRIPKEYMAGSIEQRWALVQGLFDTDGSVSDDTRVRVSYSTFSEGLAKDIESLLQSLGVASTVLLNTRTRDDGDKVRELNEYTVRVKASIEDKDKFFRLGRKRDIVEKWRAKDSRTRVKKFDFVGIADIIKLDRQDAQCIMVDNEEHLYQAGQFVVTHNTEMCKQLASILFDDDRSLLRFDMTEYATEDSLERFRDQLTTRVWSRPYSIVLLDEVEKACSPVTRILLQVLDDGRLTDRNNREVSFTNCYMILTTNAASEIYRNIAQYGESDTGDDQIMREYDKLIRRSITQTTGDNRFPPELLGRIDCIVPFQPLSENTMREIVKMRLNKLIDEVRMKHNVKLKIDSKVIDYLVGDKLTTDSDSGGARSVMSQLEADVTTPVAKYINANPYVPIIGVAVQGTMTSEDKYRLKSGASIKVGAVRNSR